MAGASGQDPAAGHPAGGGPSGTDGRNPPSGQGPGTGPVRSPELIAIGEVLRPHGIHGEVRVYPLTDFVERFLHTQRVIVAEPSGNEREVAVERARLHQGVVVVKLAGVDTRDAAEELRGARLCVPPSELVPLPEGHYFVFQLIGLSVVTEQGEPVGTVREVLSRAANDVYVVEHPDRARPREVLIPAIREVVREIDLTAGRIVIRPIPGLLGEEPGR